MGRLSKFLTSNQEDVWENSPIMKTTMGAPAFKYVVAIVFMLSCLVGCNYHCIESFPAVNSNPLWLRWLRGQRAAQLIQPAALAAPVSLEYNNQESNSEGKEIATPTNQVALVQSSASAVGTTQERGERRFEDRRFPGFAIFNDFGTTTAVINNIQTRNDHIKLSISTTSAVVQWCYFCK